MTLTEDIYKAAKRREAAVLRINYRLMDLHPLDRMARVLSWIGLDDLEHIADFLDERVGGTATDHRKLIIGMKNDRSSLTKMVEETIGRDPQN